MSHHVDRASRYVWIVATRLFATVLTAALAPALLEAQSLPSGWTATDIGSPALSGTSTHSGGTFTLEGGGVDIWDPSDQFRFVHRRMTGDGSVIARVTSIENTHHWAKAGVMIRESLSATSRHAFALVSPGKGVAFQRRTSTGGASANTSVSGAAPMWLKLDRSGSTITASRSSDGSSWTRIGEATISMGSTVYAGLAVTSHQPSTRATARFTNVTVGAPASGGTLPSGWTFADVGSPAVRGSAAASGGEFTLNASGADIWGTSDQFGFAYRQVSGDVDVIARVNSLQGPHVWSKAGLMVRASLSANSAHASFFTSVSRGHAFQRRPATGLASVHTAGGSGTAPVWFKLERRGSAITAFRSSNGTSWTMIDSQTLTLGSSFYVGLAVTSHYSSRAATAVFSQVTVSSASSTPTPPSVSLTSPGSGATFTAPATVALAATASDDDGIAAVEFYANGTRLATDSSSPYTYNWTNVPAGSYSLTAVARDQTGATATSAVRSITVQATGGGNRPPTVSLTAPADGATFTTPVSVTISANASDGDGTVARVDFFAGSTLVGSDTTSPYSVNWSNVPAGSYTLTAVARDNAGATTTSAGRTITVGSPSPPTRAVFNPSSNHDTAVTRYTLDIFTAGANPDTATPMATQNLGKPQIVNGECSADIAGTINGLPGGTYFATVRAVGSGGTSARAISPNFVR